jgi:cytochrome c oxidase subunit IV
MSEHEQPIVSFRTNAVIWLLLLVLTATTVYVSRLPLGPFHIWAGIGIAVVKSSLVILIFMQLKYEQPLFKGLLLIALTILGIFISLTFFDTLYR